MTTEVRAGYGFFLSLVTAVLWGILPLFLMICLQAMDSATITIYRFTTAAIVVALVLYFRKALPTRAHFTKGSFILAFGATVMLVVNYTFNVVGLQYLSPGSVQVLMQIAPFALMLGGIWFYKEKFTRLQKWGAVSLLLGLILFFNQRLPQILVSETESPIGIVFIIIAAISWAGYALCQKVLMKQLTAMQLTLFLYVFGAIILLPFSEVAAIEKMNSVQMGALIFCCLNTLIAYGAFTEALRVWHASRVSAILALAPVFTFITMAIADSLFPNHFTQPDIGPIAYFGALMVMCGSIMAAIGREKRI